MVEKPFKSGMIKEDGVVGVENKLITQLEKVLPKGFYVPKEIRLLYQWIEDNALYSDRGGMRYGFLFSEDVMIDSWTETMREGGTNITFYAKGSEGLNYRFRIGEDDEKFEEIKNRLCIFAHSGSDGSQCAFWLTENNEIKIVHMGSGSGSCLTCVLADEAIDFLRLLAIGYDEICWDEEFSYPPNEGSNELFVKPNKKYQNWVKSTFKVNIPNTALEIVKHPATLNDSDSEDVFLNWYLKFLNTE